MGTNGIDCNHEYIPCYFRPKKKKLFVSCNGLKKNRVGRLVKKKFIIFLVKNVLLMHIFTLIGSWEGRKNFRVEIFLNKNLLG